MTRKRDRVGMHGLLKFADAMFLSIFSSRVFGIGDFSPLPADTALIDQ
jgi:hypothetical protein